MVVISCDTRVEYALKYHLIMNSGYGANKLPEGILIVKTSMVVKIVSIRVDQSDIVARSYSHHQKKLLQLNDSVGHCTR